MGFGNPSLSPNLNPSAAVEISHHSYIHQFREINSVEINVFFYEFVHTCKGSFILERKRKRLFSLIFVGAAVALM